jgi:rare lipoprotein A
MGNTKHRRAAQSLALLAVGWIAAGCGTIAPPAPPPAPVAVPPPAPPPPPPPARPPEDAKPRVERISPGHPNQPYETRGRRYEPHSSDVPMREIGLASWYGEPFHGRRAANGERYNMNVMTAAHRTMPLPSYARVRNLANGREVIVRVNDRGPFYTDRIIDLSRAAARKLGFSGLAMVEVERLTHDDIRSGAWRQRSSAATAATKSVARPAALAQAGAVR